MYNTIGWPKLDDGETVHSKIIETNENEVSNCDHAQYWN